MRLLKIVMPFVVLSFAVSCSEETPKKDSAISDFGKGEAIPLDVGMDLGSTDATSHEATLSDTAIQPDTVVQVDTVTLDSNLTTCSTDNECQLFEDCCECTAIYTWESRTPCLTACLQTVCSALGLQQAESYCVNGNCFVGEGTALQCTSDSDCKVVNDCCYCMAVRQSLPILSCPVMCLISSCTAEGISNPLAVCVSGKCRLAP